MARGDAYLPRTRILSGYMKGLFPNPYLLIPLSLYLISIYIHPFIPFLSPLLFRRSPLVGGLHFSPLLFFVSFFSGGPSLWGVSTLSYVSFLCTIYIRRSLPVGGLHPCSMYLACFPDFPLFCSMSLALPDPIFPHPSLSIFSPLWNSRASLH